MSSGSARVKRRLKHIASGAVSRARRSSLAAWLRSEDAPRSPSQPEIYSTFVDEFGDSHPLDGGYRDRIKPDWRSMLAPPPEHLTAKQVADAPGAALASVDAMLRLLRICGATPRPEARLLEVGCHLGERAGALAARGFEVTALYFPDYYVQQMRGQRPPTETRSQEVARLQGLQEEIRQSFLANGVPRPTFDRVYLLPADIQTFDAAPGSFDGVVSWETLEHLRDPEACLRRMFLLLASGGIAFHEYDPFFNTSGGHSLCTLDFPYGHACLSEEDFERYLRRYRPQEADMALRFFRHNLNRLTQRQLRDLLDRIGFETIAFIAWPERADLDAIGELTLRQVQRHHPSATLADLLARRVWLVLRKPT